MDKPADISDDMIQKLAFLLDTIRSKRTGGSISDEAQARYSERSVQSLVDHLVDEIKELEL